jgi:hypothetical protein
MNDFSHGRLATILFRGSGKRERLLICAASVFLRNKMQKEIRAQLDSLTKTEPSFVEPMECLSVSKLPEGLGWIWEILCGPPHKISSVAPDVMWRWGRGFALGCT